METFGKDVSRAIPGIRVRCRVCERILQIENSARYRFQVALGRPFAKRRRSRSIARKAAPRDRALAQGGAGLGPSGHDHSAKLRDALWD